MKKKFILLLIALTVVLPCAYAETDKEYAQKQQMLNEQFVYMLSYDPKLEETKRMVEQGADVNFLAGDWARTPLGSLLFFTSDDTNGEAMAPINNIEENYQIAQYLIERGADVNDDNLLAEACLNCYAQNRLKVIKLLVNNGADVNLDDEYGRTPLFTIVESGIDNYEIVQFLLDHKATVNICDDKGVTPLMVASSHNQAQSVELLIKAGADVNAKDDNGYTALKYAQDKLSKITDKDHRAVYEKIIQLLKQSGAEE